MHLMPGLTPYMLQPDLYPMPVGDFMAVCHWIDNYNAPAE